MTWRADLVDALGGNLEPGPGLPATIAPGDSTVTMTSRFAGDEIGAGVGSLGPIDATCAATFTVEPGMIIAGAAGGFERGACLVVPYQPE